MDRSFLLPTGRTERELRERDLTFAKGYLLLVFTIIFFVVGIYIVLVSKLMPDTGNNILDFIKQVGFQI